MLEILQPQSSQQQSFPTAFDKIETVSSASTYGNATIVSLGPNARTSICSYGPNTTIMSSVSSACSCILEDLEMRQTTETITVKSVVTKVVFPLLETVWTTIVAPIITKVVITILKHPLQTRRLRRHEPSILQPMSVAVNTHAGPLSAGSCSSKNGTICPCSLLVWQLLSHRLGGGFWSASCWNARRKMVDHLSVSRVAKHFTCWTRSTGSDAGPMVHLQDYSF